ncbi:hypothetical protein BC936DRAFT_140478 [Jimgerdemannia flammicorona]|uniref:Uncharacterized protein n=1 Tax=Jimgerdemannia flammicorona TaxID=994334 RepID=A0A433DGS1_9FUNG|nr:hypothetical protein BC936DRAFT_140478 [Jimgerdemannia flammicorona]
MKTIDQAKDTPAKLATSLANLAERLPPVEEPARSTITALEQLREEMEQNKQARSARDHHASARAAISAELAEKRAQFDRDLRKRHDQMEERHQKLMREATYQNLVGGKMVR